MVEEKSFIFEIYGRLLKAHRTSPIIDSRDIVNKIGVVGLNPQAVINEMVESGLLKRVGMSSFRLNVNQKEVATLSEKIGKSNKNLLRTVANEHVFESYGFGEDQYAMGLKEDRFRVGDKIKVSSKGAQKKYMDVPAGTIGIIRNINGDDLVVNWNNSQVNSTRISVEDAEPVLEGIRGDDGEIGSGEKPLDIDAGTPTPSAAAPEPIEPAKDVSMKGTQKLQDNLKVTTTYIAPNDMEASSTTSEIKRTLVDKGASIEVNLTSINPYVFSITGAPGDVSIAEFYLSTILFNVLADKTETNKLKITKERATQLTVGENRVNELFGFGGKFGGPKVNYKVGDKVRMGGDIIPGGKEAEVVVTKVTGKDVSVKLPDGNELTFKVV